MSYDEVRDSLGRCRKALEKGDQELELERLLDALEQLTGALESDLMQVKGALSHLARLLEEHRRH
ncbi:MAG TPA: hypothetical protein VF329_13650 [Gammaproteobacteria bacterium]